MITNFNTGNNAKSGSEWLNGFKEMCKKFSKSKTKVGIGLAISFSAIAVIFKYGVEYSSKQLISFTSSEIDCFTIILIGIIFLVLSIMSIMNIIQCKRLNTKVDITTEQLEKTNNTLINVCKTLTVIFDKVEEISETNDEFEEDVLIMFRDLKSLQIDNMLEIRKMGGNE